MAGNSSDSFYALIEAALNGLPAGDTGESAGDGSVDQDPKDVNLVDPVNYTDPIVWHDPVDFGGSIAVSWEPKDGPMSNDGFGAYEKMDRTKTDGVWYPLVKVNTTNIKTTNLHTLTLDYSGMLPKVSVTIYDPEGTLKENEVPGMNNLVDVILVPAADGAYRKVSLRFYSEAAVVETPYTTYSGEVLVKPFNQKDRNGDITFNGRPIYTQNGCTAASNGHACSQPPNAKPNFWELSHVVANTCGLGFASTQHVKDVDDRLPRQICYQSFKDYMAEQVRFSGLDEDSIFDIYVDLYGYLTIINLAWLMTEEVTIKHLGIHAEQGMRTTDAPGQMPEVTYSGMVNRTIHNSNITGAKSNMEFDEYDFITDYWAVKHDGTLRTHYRFTPEGSGDGNNSMKPHQQQIIENSSDGLAVKDYEVCAKPDVKVCMCADWYDTGEQEEIRRAYFDKLRARILKVHMCETNLGLQRGTLVNVQVMSSNVNTKQAVMTKTGNVDGRNDSVKPDKMDLDFDKKAALTNDGMQMPHPAYSGLYYIDAMEFRYSDRNTRTDQWLYLIKKGPLTNMSNRSTPPRMDEDYYGQATDQDTPADGGGTLPDADGIVPWIFS
jgi:hypothetical protein